MEIQLILGLLFLAVIAYLVFGKKPAAAVKVTTTETEPVILNQLPVEQSVSVVEETPVKKPRKPRAVKTIVPAVKTVKAKSPSTVKSKATVKTTAKKTTAKSKKV